LKGASRGTRNLKGKLPDEMIPDRTNQNTKMEIRGML